MAIPGQHPTVHVGPPTSCAIALVQFPMAATMQLRSMLRFTIRDVLLLTLVVGLAAGWVMDRGRLATERDESNNRALEFHLNFFR